MNMRLLGHRVKEVKPISDAEAMTRGADLFGEVFVYAVSAGAIVIEYQRREYESSVKAEEKRKRATQKQKEREQQILSIHQRIDRLQSQNEELYNQLKQIQEKLESERGNQKKKLF